MSRDNVLLIVWGQWHVVPPWKDDSFGSHTQAEKGDDGLFTLRDFPALLHLSSLCKHAGVEKESSDERYLSDEAMVRETSTEKHYRTIRRGEKIGSCIFHSQQKYIISIFFLTRN